MIGRRLRRLAQPLGVAGDQHQVVPVGGEPARERRADARGRAGDERRPPGHAPGRSFGGADGSDPGGVDGSGPAAADGSEPGEVVGGTGGYAG